MTELTPESALAAVRASAARNGAADLDTTLYVNGITHHLQPDPGDTLTLEITATADRPVTDQVLDTIRQYAPLTSHTTGTTTWHTCQLTTTDAWNLAHTLDQDPDPDHLYDDAPN